ncbi:MAG TPA: FHA domain-containing protein [Thermoanaerobaculia bacterium]
MADKRCENGHFIDESWDICPYCPQDASEPEIPVVRPRGVESRPATSPGSSSAATGTFEPVTRRDDTASVPGRSSMSSSSSAAAVLPMDRTVAASRLDAQKRYVVGWLVALSGSTRGESYPVRMGRNVIGRDRKSDIVINDDQASSHHADLVFRPEEKRFILMDHNSTNGTYVNELEIEPRRDLAPKDVIRIGSHRFIFTPLCHDGFHWDDEGPLK